MSKFQKYNPFREPNWRYNRVLELAERQGAPGRVSWRTDDDYVKVAKNFVVQYNRLPEEERNQLFASNPGLYYAYMLNEAPDEEVNCMVQARILAGETDAEIADHICTLPATIEWYEALFFNVRDRLGCQDWIVSTILGPSAERGVKDRSFDFAAKMFGYFGGSLALEVIATGFNIEDRPKGRDQVSDFLDTATMIGLKRKSAMAAMTFEVNKFNVMQLFDTHARLMEMERSADAAGAIQNNYEKNVASLFKEMDWTAGIEGKRPMPGNSPLRKFRGLAAEPRAEELAQLGKGNDDELYEKLSILKLPPPRKVDDATHVEGS